MLKRKRGDAAPASPGEARSGAAEVNYLELSFAKVPIFSACSTAELMRVASLCTLFDARPGEAVVTEGEIGFDFYVILRGDAVVKHDGVEVGRLTAGDFFGELTLAVLSKPSFREVLQDAPVRENVFLGMARRLHQLDAST